MINSNISHGVTFEWVEQTDNNCKFKKDLGYYSTPEYLQNCIDKVRMIVKKKYLTILFSHAKQYDDEAKIRCIAGTHKYAREFSQNLIKSFPEKFAFIHIASDDHNNKGVKNDQKNGIEWLHAETGYPENVNDDFFIRYFPVNLEEKKDMEVSGAFPERIVNWIIKSEDDSRQDVGRMKELKELMYQGKVKTLTLLQAPIQVKA